MEPRPLNKPQRPTPQPASTPPGERGSGVPPYGSTSSVPPASGAAVPPYRPPGSPTDSSYSSGGLGRPSGIGGVGGLDPAAQHGSWYEPPNPTMPGPQPLTHGYSPGPALTPIDGGRGARVLGPILALLVLAAIVGTAVFFILRQFGDDNPRSNNLAAENGTTVAQTGPTVTPTADGEQGSEATQETGAVAGADETAAPTEAPAGPSAGETPTPEDAAAAEPTRSSPPSARSLLPAPDDVGNRFARTEDDKRTREAVADSFSNPEDALSKLEGWKWRENAYRTFEIPAGDNPLASETTVVNISIHRFGEEQGAKDALNYFAEDVIATQGLEEFRIDRIGEQTRALRGDAEGSNLVVLYVRNGNYLIRIGGYSLEGDPTEDLIALAQSIIAS
jgi:hypothetical protein